MSSFIFIIFVAVTLLVTRWAAGNTRSRGDFYVAHGRITPAQNGLAIAGEYIAAATLLGYTTLFYTAGVDTFIYMVGAMVALLIILVLIAQPLRNLGRYTFVDVCAVRFAERPIRLVAASTTLSILTLMMVGQLVGAGSLIEILFDIPFEVAVIVVGALMTVYVMFGGMYATTWVQIIKAGLVLITGSVLAGLVLARFDFSLDALLRTAATHHPRGTQFLARGGLVHDVGDGLSLALTLALGPAGLPHVLMRLFTVRDARAAGRSIVYAMGFIGYFYLLIPIFGFGAAAVVRGNDAYAGPGGALRGGDNMALLHLTQEIGGPALFGLMSAVTFATILAVVSGICLSAAATVSHDLYARVIRNSTGISERAELLISRTTVAFFAAASTLLALAFKGQNILFMTVLGVSIAASVNFPALMASMYWRGASTYGVVAGALTGLITCVVLITFGPTIWVGVLHHAEPAFPLQYPTLISLPASALVMLVVSVLDQSKSAQIGREAFDRHQEVTLIGARGGPST